MDEKFLSWLEEQPKSIADGIYKNNTDAKWAARVIDLYKADTGLTKKKTKASPSAADAVTKTPARTVLLMLQAVKFGSFRNPYP